MGELDERFRRLQSEWEFLESWNDRYERLLELGQSSEPFPEADRNEANFVPGCTSPVWLKVGVEGGRLRVAGASDGTVANALVALACHLYDGVSTWEAQTWNLDVAAELGLNRNLTPTRANAFAKLLARLRTLSYAVPEVRREPTYENRFGGLTRLFGDAALGSLRRARVAVVGLGGVGSWTVEALARSGIGALVLIDRDDVCVTNTNRQLPALGEAYGRLKAEALRDRVLDINPDCHVDVRAEFLTSQNAERLLERPLDFVVDAIDQVRDKATIVRTCRKLSIPFVVCGGAGGKTDPTQIRIVDLGQERGDALLKSLKRTLKDSAFAPKSNGSWGIECVTSLESSILPWEVCSSVAAPSEGGGSRIDCATGFGAASFSTGAFGLALASYVVRKIVASQRSDRLFVHSGGSA